LPRPSKPKDGSGSSSPTHTSVPGLPIKKVDGGDHSPSDQLPIPGDTKAGNDAVSESLPVPSKVSPDSLPSVSSATPRPATTEKDGTVSPAPVDAPSPAPQAASPQTVFVSIPRRRR
ncbi:hypothetical protein T11_2931, partial [Trichinella zimbabwensis]